MLVAVQLLLADQQTLVVSVVVGVPELAALFVAVVLATRLSSFADSFAHK